MPITDEITAALSQKVYCFSAAIMPSTIPMMLAKVMEKMARIAVIKIFSESVSDTFRQVWYERPRYGYFTETDYI